MEKSKVLQLLKGFSAWDLRNLGQFLRSPYHNRRPDVIRLYEFFLAEKARPSPDFSDAAAIRAVWPDARPGSVDYPNLRSYLYKLAEKYLAAEEIFDDEILLKMRLAKALERRNKTAHFDQAMRDLRSIVTKKERRNPEYLRRQFELEYQAFDHASSRKRMEETNLEAVTRLLDTHYFAEKLKLACAQLSFQKVRPKAYDLSILPGVVAYLQENTGWLSHPAIAIYYYAYLALTEKDNESHFHAVRRLLRECSDLFEEREIRDIYLLCINYCIDGSNRGERLYTREGFELYREAIAQGFLLSDGRLSNHSYINTAAFGIVLREYDWVESFIQDYRYKMARDGDGAYRFCLAWLRHAQGHYAEAMRLLAEFGTDDPYYFLIAKGLLAKIFYEQAEINALEALLDTMRIYLHRHEGMNKGVKAHFKQIIDLMSRLLKLIPGDRKAKAALMTAIEKLPLAADREWFLKQLK